MPWVTLGLGSNASADANLSSCLDELLLQFHDLALSSVFQSSSANGAAGQDYLNMVVGINTDMALQELVQVLKKIEDKHGRGRDAANADMANAEMANAEMVSLDIDLLTYGDKTGNFAGIKLPRPEILHAAHVLWPLSQVAPRHRHPVLKQTWQALWQAYDGQQQIRPIHFVWHERVISRAEVP